MGRYNLHVLDAVGTCTHCGRGARRTQGGEEKESESGAVNKDVRREAGLEAFPGSSQLYGDAMFDRRCRYCARFIKMPESIMITEYGQCDTVGHCGRCGDVKLVFEGFF